MLLLSLLLLLILPIMASHRVVYNSPLCSQSHRIKIIWYIALLFFLSSWLFFSFVYSLLKSFYLFKFDPIIYFNKRPSHPFYRKLHFDDYFSEHLSYHYSNNKSMDSGFWYGLYSLRLQPPSSSSSLSLMFSWPFYYFFFFFIIIFFFHQLTLFYSSTARKFS
jgi:hypothetical protein